MPKLTPVLACAVAAALYAAWAATPAFAEKIGVAAAVKPEATSKPPGQEMRTLRIGNSVVYNERIDTTETGVVQVLLLDGSTFTVGPNSSLVIDRFVYDPRRGKTSLVATFSKGALRFVGGKVSKQDGGVVVKTPPGTLTVRGGIFQALVQGQNKALFQFLFGDHLSLSRRGKAYTLFNPGNTIEVSKPGAPVLRKTPPEEVARLLAAISGTPVKLAGRKGRPFPRYYGFHPTGWADQPFVDNWFDFITTDRIRTLTPPQPPRPPNYPNYSLTRP